MPSSPLPACPLPHQKRNHRAPSSLRIPHRALLKICTLLFAATVLQVTARATVTLHTLFSSHAVLQRDKPLPVWGWASPGEAVSVTIGSKTASAVTGPGGSWLVTLPAQPASTQPLTLTVAGTNTITVTDVLMGDVWLCSGQSNMALSVGGLLTPESKIDYQTADYPLIRQMGVEVTPADNPQTNVTGQWLLCTPAKASQFCAVGFYFAIKVHKATGVPIGILRSAKGSTIIECWQSEETLMNTLGIEPYPTQMRDSLALWETEKANALAAGIQPDSPEYPAYPFNETIRRPRCVTHYNGMIAPLAPFAMRGAIWYQGEGNAVDFPSSQAYTRKLRALISSWRTLLGDANLPFYIVQLPNYLAPYDAPAGGDRWSWMREAQRQCLAIPNTRLAVTIDIGEELDIHPKNKFDVGERLGLLALKHEYGQGTLIASGPVFRDLLVEGSKLRLRFDSVGAGLMVGKKTGREHAVEDPASALGRFAVAGADKQWAWATAVIDGDTVLVSAPTVPAPVAVRYAYSTNPTGANLYNRNGLPSGPFASDAVIIPVTGAPTISDVSDQTTAPGAAVGPIPFTIGDGQTAAGSLVITKHSSNPTLLPDQAIAIGGSGASRTVTVTPAAGRMGTATVTLAVSDGAFTTVDTFNLSVLSTNLQTLEWRSVLNHALVPSGLTVPPIGLVEPRQGGIRRIEVTFSEPIVLRNPGSAVSVSGVNASGSVSLQSLGITLQASTITNTLVVVFANSSGPCALPDATKWQFALVPAEITGSSGSALTASAATMRTISGLVGDTDGNGRVNGIDLNQIQHTGDAALPPPDQLRADINGDGSVSPTDHAASWANRAKRIDTISNP